MKPGALVSSKVANSAQHVGRLASTEQDVGGDLLNDPRKRANYKKLRDSLVLLGKREPRSEHERRSSFVSVSCDDDMDDEELDELLSCLVFELGTGTSDSFGKANGHLELPADANSGDAIVARFDGDQENDDHSKADAEHGSSEKQSSRSKFSMRRRSSSNIRLLVGRGKRLCSQSVKFDRVEIREYAVELGDNPSCTSGPALTFGWDYVTVLRRPISTYEIYRAPRRKNEELHLPPRIREEILKANGFTKEEVASAVKNIADDRIRRMRTILNMKYSVYEEKMESVGRKMKKLLRRPKKEDVLVSKSMADVNQPGKVARRGSLLSSGAASSPMLRRGSLTLTGGASRRGSLTGNNSPSTPKLRRGSMSLSEVPSFKSRRGSLTFGKRGKSTAVVSPCA